MAKLSPQHKLILAYLKKDRKLTNKLAIIALGVGSLSSRIAELRKQGYDIVDETEYDHNDVPFKKYKLGTIQPVDESGQGSGFGVSPS